MVDAHCHLQDIPDFDISDLEFVICSGASLSQAIRLLKLLPNTQMSMPRLVFIQNQMTILINLEVL